MERPVDSNAVRRRWRFPRLLKITAVNGGGKTVRDVTDLQVNPPAECAGYFRGRVELLGSPFGGCAAGSGAQKTAMRCGVSRNC